MAGIRRPPLSEEDYRFIWRYISQDNPDAADRLLRRIDAKLELYALHPSMGTSRDSISPGLRSFPVGSYLIFYRTISGGIELARVIHAARDLKTAFKSSPGR